jgi:glutaredoxin
LKDLLTEYGVDFDSVDVDLMFKEERDELFAKMAPYNEKKAFPVTFIGNKAIVGFQKDVIMEELGLKYEC